MDNRYFIYLYKNRFLLLYILFGFLSLSSELILRNLLQNIIDTNLANFLAVGSGILIAYFLNVNFNFKVPKNRIKISIIYFVLVSLLSIFIQYTIGNFTQINFFQNRFLLSGALFFIAYFWAKIQLFPKFQKPIWLRILRGLQPWDSFSDILILWGPNHENIMREIIARQWFFLSWMFYIPLR